MHTVVCAAGCFGKSCAFHAENQVSVLAEATIFVSFVGTHFS